MMNLLKLCKVVLMFWLVIISLPTIACDVCGCGGGNVFLGMMPQYKKSFAGIRYHHRSFDSHLGQATDFFRTRETFHVAEFYGGISVSKKMQAMVFAPYQFHKQSDKHDVVSKHGVGDITALVNYQLWEKPGLNKDEKPLLHRVSMGAGIKLPTGAWKFDDNGGLGDNANFQLGTGTLDVMGVGQYQYLNNNFGVNAIAAYKINGTNGMGYHFGNRLSWNAQAFQKIKIADNFSINPNAGFTGENMLQDTRAGKKIAETGGWLINAAIGSELSTKTFSTGLLWQQPIDQNLGDGALQSRARWMVYMAFSF